MIEIPLTQNKVAFIDDEDYKIISLFKWYAYKNRNIFYAATDVTIDNKKIMLLMHRFIMNLKSDKIADHADRDGLNNQRYNLRKCNCSQNHMNKKKKKDSSSQFKGVFWLKKNKKWMAQIKLNRKATYLGCFISEIEAAKVYDKKAQELFGKFARPNFN